MPELEFGSRKAANDVREKVSEYRAASDDKRSKTVKLKPSTPDRIVERVEQEAYTSQGSGRESAGQAELSDAEQKSLKRQHDTFSWQEHGFEAMRVKAAMQRKGATEWQDFYEPGEGVGGALQNLRASKSRSAATGASIGVGGQRTDEEELTGGGRQRTQAERAQAGQVRNAKRPAVVGRDPDAISFIREEQRFGGDVFDITFGETRRGVPTSSGRDRELVEQRNEQRSERAQRMDDRRAAEMTTDPIEWATDPSHYDFPGVDTVEPAAKHAARPERARETDERELAPRASSVREWAADPDQYDWPGVDTPPAMGLGPDEPEPGGLGGAEIEPPAAPEERTQGSSLFAGTAVAPRDLEPEPAAGGGQLGPRPSSQRLSESAYQGLASGTAADMAFDRAERERTAGGTGFPPAEGGGNADKSAGPGPDNPLMADTRDRQDTLGFAADPTEARESRAAVEESGGGILEDTRESVDRGPDLGPDVDAGDQGSLPGFDDGDDDGPDLSGFLP